MQCVKHAGTIITKAALMNSSVMIDFGNKCELNTLLDNLWIYLHPESKLARTKDPYNTSLEESNNNFNEQESKIYKLLMIVANITLRAIPIGAISVSLQLRISIKKGFTTRPSIRAIQMDFDIEHIETTPR